MSVGVNIGVAMQQVATSAALVFDPATQFSAGQKGGYWIVHPDNCFQTADTSTPAAVGDPVGRLNDLSGNGNHMVFDGTASKRPVLRADGSVYYLEYDAIDDSLASTLDLAAGGGEPDRWIIAEAFKDATSGGDFIALNGGNNRLFMADSGSVFNSNYGVDTVHVARFDNGADLAEADVNTRGECYTLFDGANTFVADITFTLFTASFSIHANSGYQMLPKFYGGMIVETAGAASEEMTDLHGWLAGLAGVAA